MAGEKSLLKVFQTQTRFPVKRFEFSLQTTVVYNFALNMRDVRVFPFSIFNRNITALIERIFS